GPPRTTPSTNGPIVWPLPPRRSTSSAGAEPTWSRRSASRSTRSSTILFLGTGLRPGSRGRPERRNISSCSDSANLLTRPGPACRPPERPASDARQANLRRQSDGRDGVMAVIGNSVRTPLSSVRQSKLRQTFHARPWPRLVVCGVRKAPGGLLAHYDPGSAGYDDFLTIA